MTSFTNAAMQHGLDCYNIAPWGRPGLGSRIAGLGGAEVPADPACVFETGPVMFPAGPVCLTVKVDGYCGDVAVMLLVLTNSAAVPGSPQVRMQLSVAELHPGQDSMQSYSVSFVAHEQIAYQLGGYIHGDGDTRAWHLSISSDRAPRPFRAALPIARRARPSQNAQDDDGVRQIGRLFDPGPPEFEQLYSQPCTSAQLADPAFSRLQVEISPSPSDVSSAVMWPAVFALRALELFDRKRPAQSIGFDANDSPLWPVLLRRGGAVVLAEPTFDPEANVDLGRLRDAITVCQPDMDKIGQRFQHTLIGEALPPAFCGLFDFAWWVARELTDWKVILRGALNVAESLGEGGVGIAVFPLDFTPGYRNEPGCAEVDLSRIMIELLSLGHRVVQARLPGFAAGEAKVTYFGILLQR